MKLDASVTIRDRIDYLYRSDSRRVFASLVRLLNDFDPADDAVHEAYVAAVEIWQREGVPANPRAWLISIGEFKAIKMLRRQGRLNELQPEIASRWMKWPMGMQLEPPSRSKTIDCVSSSPAAIPLQTQIC